MLGLLTAGAAWLLVAQVAAPPIQNSLADATLRGDVMRTVLSGAEAIVPGCTVAQAGRTLNVGPARVTRQPDPEQNWQEVWPVSMCGRTTLLQMDFVHTPADGGTDFRVTLWQGDRGARDGGK